MTARLFAAAALPLALVLFVGCDETAPPATGPVVAPPATAEVPKAPEGPATGPAPSTPASTSQKQLTAP